MNRNDLGTRLRALRTERGLSLSQLESATSISSSFLSLVESGKSDITISRLTFGNWAFNPSTNPTNSSLTRSVEAPA